jgi:hypothetical protein
MADFVFNDLFLKQYYNDILSFKKDIGEFVQFYTQVRNLAFDIYIHRDRFLNEIRLGDKDFRVALSDTTQFASGQKQQILSILDRSRPSLPHESNIPAGISFVYCGNAIPLTGLAEAAFLQYMDEGVVLYSISNSDFAVTPLLVSIIEQKKMIAESAICNFFTIALLKNYCSTFAQPLQSWQDMFNYITNNYRHIEVLSDAVRNLSAEPFDKKICETVIRNLAAAESMVAAKTDEAYHELDEKYCHGERAWFSDESDSRKNDSRLAKRLTYTINGASVQCFYHGKISHRAYRIYLSSKPKRNQRLYVAYIGEHL